MTNIKRPAVAVLLALSSLGVCSGVLVAAEANMQPPPSTDVSRQGGTLSDKLGATNGVIHPQDTVDPAMEKQAPATGTMPVIPPAGSPGGVPGVQPK